MVVGTDLLTRNNVVHHDAALLAWDCETFQFIGKEDWRDLWVLVLDGLVYCEFVCVVVADQAPDDHVALYIACN